MILVVELVSAIISLLLFCTAIDGDTLRCGEGRYRLLGIDAPEMAGRCRKGRVCVQGNPDMSKAGLAALTAGRKVKLIVVGKDRYDRGLVQASVDGRDLSCAQLRARRAVYVSKWDNHGRIAHICPEATRKRR